MFVKTRRLRNRQKLFSQWADLAFTEKGSSRISRFVRGPQAAARFLCMSPRLNEPKHIVAEATTDIQPDRRSTQDRELSEDGSINLEVMPDSRLSLNRDLGLGHPMWPGLRSEMLGLLTSKCCSSKCRKRSISAKQLKHKPPLGSCSGRLVLPPLTLQSYLLTLYCPLICRPQRT